VVVEVLVIATLVVATLQTLVVLVAVDEALLSSMDLELLTKVMPVAVVVIIQFIMLVVVVVELVLLANLA
jgi:hypothetical protein